MEKIIFWCVIPELGIVQDSKTYALQMSRDFSVCSWDLKESDHVILVHKQTNLGGN